MISISSLTKRVISVTALHCASFQTSSSLSYSAIRRAPSSSLLANLRRHPPQRNPQQCCSVSTSTVLTATTRDAEMAIGEMAENKVLSDVVDEDKLMRDVLYRIRDCNRMPDDLRSNIVDFVVDGSVLGKVDPKVAEILCSTRVATTPGGPARPVFAMVSSQGGKAFLTLSEEAAGTTNESRTRAVAAVMEEMRTIGVVTGWRDELYPVSGSFYDPPFFVMERAATDLLGVLSYGVHVNGILLPENEPSSSGDNNDNNNELPLMWMARRSKTKSKYPSMLDHIVAGGQPEGLGLMENVIKECEEEAGIPPEIARPGVNLKPAGVVSYEEANRCFFRGSSERNSSNSAEGGEDSFYTISRVVLFNYDLYLPGDFVPKPVDGEVEEFFLWRIDQIKESMAPDFRDPIKPNCYLVIIDYLMRMGYISPETKGYLDVLRELRSGDCR